MFKISSRKAIQSLILQNYQRKILNIQQYYNSNKYLNHKQKERLDYFIDRSIKFCQNMKKINYDRTIFVKDSTTRVVNKSQYKVYDQLFKMLVDLSREITADNALSYDNKKELMNNISYLVGYVRGKKNTVVK